MALDRWQAKQEGNGMTLNFGSIGGPISKSNALTLMSELSAYCAGTLDGGAVNASKTATAAAPAGGGKKKPGRKTK